MELVLSVGICVFSRLIKFVGRLEMIFWGTWHMEDGRLVGGWIDWILWEGEGMRFWVCGAVDGGGGKGENRKRGIDLVAEDGDGDGDGMD